MGRYVSPVASGTASNMTSDFSSTNSTKNAGGFLTEYIANDITYTNITYEDDSGSAAEYGAIYKKVTSWTETNNVTNQSKSVAVNYDSETGEVTSLTIT